MTTLRDTLNQLAAEFAASVLHAIRGASLEEILGETAGRIGRARIAEGRGRVAAKKKSGRLSRRSADDIAHLVDQIVDLLSKRPKGLRAEEIRQQLGLEAKELPRPIAEALGAKRITKQGKKRATTYFAKGAGAAAPAKRGNDKKARGKSSKKGDKGGKANAMPAAATTNGAQTA